MIILTALQTRVIGVMLEKSVTTPEQYPLSLNALTNGCNQKSNREPVMSLSEAEVQNAVDELIEMKILMVDSDVSGRVNKYKQRFCNTLFGHFQFTEQQTALICVLFLRGAQTPGELRTRTNRLADFANVNEVELTLEQLQNLDNESFVIKLAREPGKRESRYMHLFADRSDLELTEIATDANLAASSNSQGKLKLRVALLEQELSELKAEIARLSALVE